MSGHGPRRRGKGEGSIFKRSRTLPSGRVVEDWVHVVSLGYDASGRRVRRTFCGPTKSAVKAKVDKLRARNGGTLSRAATTTVAEYLERWIADVRRSRSARTASSYEARIQAFALPNIGKVRLEDLDGRKIAWLYETLTARGVSADNLQKLRKALRRAFNVAIGQGLITRNPVAHVEAPRHRPTVRASYDAAEVSQLFRAARGDRFEAMFRLGVLALMRPGELFALHRDDVDVDRGQIDVRHSLEDDGGRLAIVPAKADSARRIPLEPTTAALLRAHLAAMDAERHGSPYVFVTARGKWLRVGPVNRALQAIAEKAKLPKITLYGLRHTGVSLLGEAGVHLRVAADLAGHAGTTITADTYTHAGEALHRDGVERAAALLLTVDEPSD